MTAQRKRIQFRNADTAGAPQLNGPLNDFARDVQLRLDALEAASAGVALLRDVYVTTGATLAVNTAPFPQAISTPDGFTPAGLVVVRVENLSAPATIATTAHMAQWRMVATNTIELQLVTGLAVNTKYRLTLAVFR